MHEPARPTLDAQPVAVASASPPTAPPFRVFTEAERRARLRRMGRVATGLLIAMGLSFLVLHIYRHQLPPWTAALRAFAEAALVGGLADWFAVTALFRRPLGLPIPHTAIIPSQKERIGYSLGRFVQQNFLAPEVVERHLGAVDLSGRALAWLERPENRQQLTDRVMASLPELLRALDSAELERLVGRNVEAQLRSVALAPLLAELIEVVAAQNKHQELLTEALQLVRTTVQKNKNQIKAAIKKETPWYVPGFVDDQLYERIMGTTDQTIAAVRREPDHPIRQQFSALLEDFVARLRQDPAAQQRIAAAQDEVLSHPVVGDYLSSLWGQIRARLEADLQQDDSAVRARVDQALTALVERLGQDPAFQGRINRTLRAAVVQLVDSQREQLSGLIAATVSNWETRTLVDRLELMVGRDLQFIRINGTLVGGLVGLLLYLLTTL